MQVAPGEPHVDVAKHDRAEGLLPGLIDRPQLHVGLSELLLHAERDRGVPGHPADRFADDDVEAPRPRYLKEVQEPAITRDGDVELGDVAGTPLLVAGGAALDVVEVGDDLAAAAGRRGLAVLELARQGQRGILIVLGGHAPVERPASASLHHVDDASGSCSVSGSLMPACDPPRRAEISTRNRRIAISCRRQRGSAMSSDAGTTSATRRMFRSRPLNPGCGAARGSARGVARRRLDAPGHLRASPRCASGGARSAQADRRAPDPAACLSTWTPNVLAGGSPG